MIVYTRPGVSFRDVQYTKPGVSLMRSGHAARFFVRLRHLHGLSLCSLSQAVRRDRGTNAKQEARPLRARAPCALFRLKKLTR